MERLRLRLRSQTVSRNSARGLSRQCRSNTSIIGSRYFAAWLVDYMSFNLSEESANLSKIKEIMDWVEGPIFSAQYTGLEDLQSIEAQLEALSINHLILGPFANENLINSDWQVTKTILLEYLQLITI